jgi:hypothetical protein
MNVLDIVADMVPLLSEKIELSVFVAMWKRVSRLRTPQNVRANSKPAGSRAPPKALTSQVRIGQLHTRTSLTHWNSSTAGLTRQTLTCMGTLRENISEKHKECRTTFRSQFVTPKGCYTKQNMKNVDCENYNNNQRK